MASHFAMRRGRLIIKVDEFGTELETPVHTVELINSDNEYTIKVGVSSLDLQNLAPDKRIDVTPMKRPRLRLMVRDDDYTSHPLGVVPLTKLEISTTRDEYTAHASISDWYAGIDPPKKKEVKTEDVLLAAVNSSIWLPIMAWRDFLEENGAKDDIVYGLTWLINHKRFPEEGWYKPEDVNEEMTAWRWLFDDGHDYAAHRLPPVGRDKLEYHVRRRYTQRPEVVARVFTSIHKAFWAAAEVIGENRDKLTEPNPPNTQQSTAEGMDEDDDPWDNID